jgi:hypothetical protein
LVLSKQLHTLACAKQALNCIGALPVSRPIDGLKSANSVMDDPPGRHHRSYAADDIFGSIPGASL